MSSVSKDGSGESSVGNIFLSVSLQFGYRVAMGDSTKNIVKVEVNSVLCSPSVLGTTDCIIEGNLFFEQDLPVINLFWLFLIIVLCVPRISFQKELFLYFLETKVRLSNTIQLP